MMQIRESNDDIIIFSAHQITKWLNAVEQRNLISYFFKYKPELIRDIICENCPEHIGEIERKAYLEREFEKGNKI